MDSNLIEYNIKGHLDSLDNPKLIYLEPGPKGAEHISLTYKSGYLYRDMPFGGVAAKPAEEVKWLYYNATMQVWIVCWK